MIAPAPPCTCDASVTFYGRRADGTAIVLDIEDPNGVNMANANARAFLRFLGIDPGPGPDGEVKLPEVRRAAIRARNTFRLRSGRLPRTATDTEMPGRCRVIEGGIDEAYFARRLGDFERFVDAVIERGATSIYWG